MRARRPWIAACALTALVGLEVPSLANDDLGSSGILLVKTCDGACKDGSSCGDGGNGLCMNGDVCVSAACANGSQCGSWTGGGVSGRTLL